MNETVKPRLFRGLRDLLPQQMAARQWIIDTIRGVYELYGFAPLGTPAVEFLDVLSGSAGSDVQSSIFTVGNPDRDKDPGDEALGLRFDLTVPLARVVAQYSELPRPFRRYQVSQVWRADKPGPGRFREFTQFDIDSVGVDSWLADVEIIAAMCDTLSALKVGAYQVRFSSRKVLNLVLKFAQVPEELRVKVRVQTGPDSFDYKSVTRPATDVFRVLDKLDKAGLEKVRRELTRGYTDESGDEIPGLGLAAEQVDRIEKFLSIASPKRAEVLQQLYSTFSGVHGAREEIDAVAGMSEQLTELGYDDDRVVLDLSIARGLAYYTGPVFEARLLDAPQFGSVFGGGRYDELVTRFSGERIPATGASIGVDRLLAALLDLERIDSRKTPAKVLVCSIDSELGREYAAMAFELRRAGIPCELYLGSKGIGKQVKHGDALGIPIVLMYGSDERAKGTVTLKDMAAGRKVSDKLGKREEWIRQRPGQVEVPRDQLVQAVRRMLE